MTTHDKPETSRQRMLRVSRAKRLTFRLLLVACLGAYGAYSYGGIRISVQGWRYLSNGNPATASAAFRYVLDRQSFTLAVPVARAALFYKIPENSGAGSDRLAVWGFERLIDDTVGRGVSRMTAAFGQPSPLSDANGKCTPVSCDLAPLVAVLASALLTILLGCSFFLRKASRFSTRFACLILALALLAWILADPYLSLRARLIQEGMPFEGLMAYDHMKYALGALIVSLNLREWVFAKWRWSLDIGSMPKPDLA